MPSSSQRPYLDACDSKAVTTAKGMQHFAIIGAGLAGLASAVFLGRAGYRVSVFERFSQAQAVGAGLLLQPSGLAVLRHLDLLTEVMARGSVVEGLIGDAQMRLESQSRCRIMDLRYAQLGVNQLDVNSRGLNHGIGIHRANLFALLLKAAEQAGARIHCGIEISQLGQHGEKRLLFDASGRDFGCCDAVVIANGSHSLLRQTLTIPQSCRPYPWGALWTIVDDTLKQPLLQQRYVGAHTMVGVLPSGPHPQHGRDCLSFFWSLPAATLPAWRQQSDGLHAWHQRLRRLWPELAPLLEHLDDPQQLAWASYADVVMPYWHQGNLLCVGDAAHGMSPQLGQGTNLALLDAWVLSCCLAEHTDIAMAFARYSQLRRHHLSFYQRASRWLTPLFQSHSRLAAFLRDWSFPWAHSVPYSRNQALRTVAGLKTGWLGDENVRLPE